MASAVGNTTTSRAATQTGRAARNRDTGCSFSVPSRDVQLYFHGRIKATLRGAPVRRGGTAALPGRAGRRGRASRRP